jgi:diguanylate cyclase (GGDEF)-like protein
MLSPGEFTPPLSPEDAYFEILIETLEGLDRQALGLFLQRYFKSIAQLELTEAEAVEYWERILARRKELTESLGTRVSIRTAMVDVLASSKHLRVPILMEYEELKKLQINAATDPLTGLYNRRLFEENFDRELNRAQRYDHKLVLVILDLHQFKEVNDRHGHLRGDMVLRAAAGTLRKSLRTSDSAFRIGGDEFALLLPEADAEQAVTLSRRIRSNYAGELAGMNLGIGVNLDFGIAVYPEDGDLKETLMRVADERLYRLKLEGRESPPVEPKASAAPGERAREFRDRQEVPPRETTPPAREIPTARGPGPQTQAEPRREEPPRRVPAIPATAAPTAPAARTPQPPAQPQGERRRWERVSLSGTRASAGMGEGSQKQARILDLGYGGVALETSATEEIPESFPAVLNVPILPAVRVSLKRIYVVRGAGGVNRIGCAFAT